MGKLDITNEHSFDGNHWNIVGYRQQMTSKQLREAIQNHGDSIMCRGELRYIKTKSLGAGMYNVWFESEKPGQVRCLNCFKSMDYKVGTCPHCGKKEF